MEEYMEFENSSDRKHEFVAGNVYAMTGATDAHNVISGKIYALLLPIAEKAGCFAYINDMKLRILKLDCVYYPDVAVTCEKFEPTSLFKEAPCVIVEVLSKSTKNVDRREKLIAYKQVASVMDYLIVWQDEIRIEHHFRRAENWADETVTGGAIKLAWNDVTLDLAEIYRQTGLSAR
jgi:Uma2 family endonuclease